ncbi:hypothetical protein BG004_000475 [Podila humilis]|nr:hypothetical protein BG004_000475 [Podila humilis]
MLRAPKVVLVLRMEIVTKIEPNKLTNPNKCDSLGSPISGPTAYVEFPKSIFGPGFLRGGQAYCVTVLLQVPTTTKNIDIGTFLVTVAMLNDQGRTIAMSSRLVSVIGPFSNFRPSNTNNFFYSVNDVVGYPNIDQEKPKKGSMTIVTFIYTSLNVLFFPLMAAQSLSQAIVTSMAVPVRLIRMVWGQVVPFMNWWWSSPLSQEGQTLNVEVIKDFVEDPQNPVYRVFVEVSDPALQVYKTTLHIDAHFSGLSMSTALIFIFGFMLCELIFAFTAWMLLRQLYINNSNISIAEVTEPQTQLQLPHQPQQRATDYPITDQETSKNELKDADGERKEFSIVPAANKTFSSPAPAPPPPPPPPPPYATHTLLFTPDLIKAHIVEKNHRMVDEAVCNKATSSIRLHEMPFVADTTLRKRRNTIQMGTRDMLERDDCLQGLGLIISTSTQEQKPNAQSSGLP